MNDDEIRKLVENYLHQTLKENEDTRAETGNPAGLSFPADPDVHEILLGEAREDLAEGRHAKLGNVADYVLDVAGITIQGGRPPKGSPEYLRLCRELLKGIVDVVMPTEIARMRGDYRNEYDARHSYLKGVLEPAQGLQAAPPTTPEEGVRWRTVSPCPS